MQGRESARRRDLWMWIVGTDLCVTVCTWGCLSSSEETHTGVQVWRAGESVCGVGSHFTTSRSTKHFSSNREGGRVGGNKICYVLFVLV